MERYRTTRAINLLELSPVFLRNTKELTPSLADSNRTLSSRETPRELCTETVESPQLDPHLLITLIIRFYLLHCVRCAATQSVTDVR